MKIAFSATLISQILCAALFPFHTRAATFINCLDDVQYWYESDLKSWDDHETAALELGGHLASVTSDTISNHIASSVPYNGRAWLGGHRSPTDRNKWLWSDQSFFDYTNWNEFEPNGDNENCMEIIRGWNHKWNNHFCGNEFPGVYMVPGGRCNTSPTKAPTPSPTKRPTQSPTKGPTEFPTKRPTQSPTKGPTRSPTKAPTPSPTKRPTQSPTKGPTSSPTKSPTPSPTKRPTQSPTKGPTLSPTKAPTSVPSTLFQGQNFSINEPNISFNDFFLNFTYVVGHSTEKTNFTLYRENCTSTDNVSDIINIAHEGKEEVDVSITKTAIGKVSSLVTPSGGIEGYSKGSIKFCIKVETLLGTTSVTFQKTNVELSYDLTDNSFEVAGNTISANEIGKEETEVTTKYGVEACICTENFDCETSTEDKVFEQNKLIHICVYPNNTSELTQISNFDMKFEQNQATTYTAVRITESGSVATAGISYMEGDGDKYLVTSRLITALFEGGKISFDVVGNAQLKFKTRQLKKVENFNLRSMEEKSIGTDEGESQFKMKVKIAKAVGKVSSTESNSTSGAMVLVVGGILVLSIMFVLFKKMKN